MKALDSIARMLFVAMSVLAMWEGDTQNATLFIAWAIYIRVAA